MAEVDAHIVREFVNDAVVSMVVRPGGVFFVKVDST